MSIDKDPSNGFQSFAFGKTFELKDGTYIVLQEQMYSPSNVDEWYASKEQEYVPDRQKFIMEKFQLDFPDIKIDDFDKLTRLVGRNLSVKEWFARANAEYAADVRLPGYLKDLISNEQYDKTSKMIVEYNDMNKKESAESAKKSEQYKKDMEEIRERYAQKRKSYIDKDKLLFILTLPAEKLPLSISLAIENFTPKDASDQREKRLFAREMLIKFKLALIKALQDGKDVVAIVDELNGK